MVDHILFIPPITENKCPHVNRFRKWQGNQTRNLVQPDILLPFSHPSKWVFKNTPAERDDLSFAKECSGDCLFSPMSGYSFLLREL